MKKVLVISDFKDRYTGEMYKAGAVIEMTDERIKEIKEVNPRLIEVVGKVETPAEPVTPETPAEPEVPTVEVPPLPEDKKGKKK